jgi:hypothetical protein
MNVLESLVELAARLPDKRERESEIARPLTAASVGGTAAALAGGLVYKRLRTRTPLAADAPPAIRALRAAAEKHGYRRIHVTERPENKVMQGIRKLLSPADKHLIVPEGRVVRTKKFKGAVFDPDATDIYEGALKIGAENKVAKSINRSKLEEYRIASSMGVNVLKTEPLGRHTDLRPGEIAKLNKGQQSKIVLHPEDFASHNPADKNIAEYRKFRRSTRTMVDRDKRQKMSTSHPGYKGWMVEEAIKKPHKFVKQPKIDIESEYRVHTIGGKSIGISSGRFNYSGGTKEAEKAAEGALKGADPKLTDNLLALDIAKDKKGAWHVIETNPGPKSGFLDPLNRMDVRGPHQLYKRVTGRYSQGASALGAAAAALPAAGAAGGLTAAMIPRPRPSRTADDSEVSDPFSKRRPRLSRFAA